MSASQSFEMHRTTFDTTINRADCCMVMLGDGWGMFVGSAALDIKMRLVLIHFDFDVYQDVVICNIAAP